MTRLKMVLLIVLLSLSFVSGCGTRVIRVSYRRPVMLAEDIKAKIYVKDKDGNWVKSSHRVRIDAGHIILSDEKE